MSGFEAKYNSACAACGERIHVGNLATYAEDVIVHVDCEDAATPERKVETCTQCWLTKPCDCEETT